MVEWMITSSILIALIILIRELFKNKIGSAARYALWLVAAVRLLVPVTVSESSFSVLNILKWEKAAGQSHVQQEKESFMGRGVWLFIQDLYEAVGQTSEEIRTDKMDPYQKKAYEADNMEMMEETAISMDPQVRMNHLSANGEFGENLLSSDWEDHNIFFRIWLWGSLCVAGIVAASNCSYHRKIYKARERYRTKPQNVLPVYVSPEVAAPCMFGLFHPAVYLTPGIEGNDRALKYILLHENTHFRHRDNVWALVRVICVCLHWYNPLVWIAAVLSRQDCELACDERTLRLLREEERIHYGRTLLDFSVQREDFPGGLQLSTSVSGGKKQLKERLMMIVGRPRRSPLSLAVTMVLVFLVSIVTFTGRVRGQEGNRTTDREAAVSDTEVGSFRNGRESVLDTAIVSVDLNDGKDYALKAGGENTGNGGEYRIEQLEFNQIRDRAEVTLQKIHLEDVKVLYTMSPEEIRENGGQMWCFATEKEVLYAKPLYTAAQMPAYEARAFSEGAGETLSELFAGGILAADLNFDGYQDFCLKGRADGENVPYYCYLWNPVEKRFEPGYMVPNLRVNEELQLIESITSDEENVKTTKYYQFDDMNVLHLVRYVEENPSPDAVFPKLDLTYCETAYALPAVDEWDYGTVYGGALTERAICLAKDALEELYDWSGTKIDTVCFCITSGGEVIFGNTSADMDASRTFYHRCYGESAGFDNWIQHMILATERVVWYSPVTQWKKPENLSRMADEEAAVWYFEQSPLTEGETVDTITTNGDEYLIKTETGNYFAVYLQPSTRELNSIYGPYGEIPIH